MTVVQTAGLEEFAKLSVTQCHRLLGDQTIGRLAFVTDGFKPMIVPVHFTFNGRDLAFLITPESDLHHVPLSWVSVEVDGIDATGDWGWSVTASGCAFDITDSMDDYAAEIRETVMDFGARERGERVVSVHLKTIGGRCFGLDPRERSNLT